jgi:hypothetical protein
MTEAKSLLLEVLATIPDGEKVAPTEDGSLYRSLESGVANLRFEPAEALPVSARSIPAVRADRPSSDRASSYKSRSDRRAGLIEVDFNGTDHDCGLE